MIKFLDLVAINKKYEKEIKEAISEVVDSGWYIQGEQVKSFESEYAAYSGSKYCIGVANGLDALRLIFKAYLEMGYMQENDEVIVPANTYIASVLAVTDNRLKPVFVEPQIDTYNIDVDLIETAITNRTRAIMIVHLYGTDCMQYKSIVIVQKI
jgi:dTDP-4-amino-4,6-dideoxygalactose transaminase